VQWFFAVAEEDRAEMLDVPGPALIHAYWAGGVDQEPTTEETVAEIARLTRQLQRQVGTATSTEQARRIEPKKGRTVRSKPTTRKRSEKR
jgi:hypothetical protein